jgi:hypothetical protein
LTILIYGRGFDVQSSGSVRGEFAGVDEFLGDIAQFGVGVL